MDLTKNTGTLNLSKEPAEPQLDEKKKKPAKPPKPKKVKLPNKDINLLAQVAGPKQSNIKLGAIFIAVGIVLGVGLVAGTVSLKVYNASLENQIEELSEKANDQSLQDKIANANVILEQINVLRTAAGSYDSVAQIVADTQKYGDDFTSDLITKLLEAEYDSTGADAEQQVTTTGLSFSEDILSIEGTTSDARNISKYVTRLTRLGIFSDVNYSGYELDSESGLYSFTVVASFNEHEYTLTEATTTQAGEDTQTETTITEGSEQS